MDYKDYLSSVFLPHLGSNLITFGTGISSGFGLLNLGFEVGLLPLAFFSSLSSFSFSMFITSFIFLLIVSFGKWSMLELSYPRRPGK